MSKITRSDFIKKKLLGGLFFASGISFLSTTPLLAFEKKLKTLKIPNDYKDIDWDKIRDQFLLRRDRYYFNTASLGPSPKTVIDRICETMKKLETTSSHGHSLTKETHQKISQFLNTDIDEIAVIRNATEGMNIIAKSITLKAGDEIILTKHEHIGGAAPWVSMIKEKGVVVKLIELDLTGETNLQIIKNAITDKTKVVSFSHVTCTTGLILPAKEIVDLCRSKGIYSCIDGAQSVGMIPIDLKNINPDFYTCSGHKWLFGPKGTGILFINKSIIKTIDPVFRGAYTDSKFDLNSLTMEYRTTAHREEYGTRNTPISLGLASAIDFITTIGIKNVDARGRELATRFRKEISKNSKIEILTPENQEYSASIITIRIKDRNNLDFNLKLNRKARLRLRGIYENNINGIRISFSIFNSTKEVDYLISYLEKMISE
tara:strand:- start:3217 stop:4512 length:1296 start_codon:yes stop_codon:yes gene_type:complete